MCVVVCLWGPEVAGSCLSLSFFALSTEVGGLWSNSELADWVRPARHLPAGTPRYHLTGPQLATPARLFVGVGDLNSGLHSRAGWALPPEPPAQPLNFCREDHDSGDSMMFFPPPSFFMNTPNKTKLEI